MAHEQPMRFTDSNGSKWRIDAYDFYSHRHHVWKDEACIGLISVTGGAGYISGCGDLDGTLWLVDSDVREHFKALVMS